MTVVKEDNASLLNNDCAGQKIAMSMPNSPTESGKNIQEPISFICRIPFRKFKLNIHPVSGGDTAVLPFMCMYCDCRFDNIELRKNHTIQTHRRYQYCIFCKKSIKNVQKLFEHFEKLHSDTFIGCVQCLERFETVDQLNLHNINTSHPLPSSSSDPNIITKSVTDSSQLITVNDLKEAFRIPTDSNSTNVSPVLNPIPSQKKLLPVHFDQSIQVPCSSKDLSDLEICTQLNVYERFRELKSSSLNDSCVNSAFATSSDNFLSNFGLIRNVESRRKSRTTDVLSKTTGFSGDNSLEKMYLCLVCGLLIDSYKKYIDHKNEEHPHVFSLNYELIGKEMKLVHNVNLVGFDNKFETVNERASSTDNETNQSLSSSGLSYNYSRKHTCNKCGKPNMNFEQLHQHILICSGLYQWISSKRKTKTTKRKSSFDEIDLEREKESQLVSNSVKTKSSSKTTKKPLVVEKGYSNTKQTYTKRKGVKRGKYNKLKAKIVPDVAPVTLSTQTSLLVKKEPQSAKTRTVKRRKKVNGRKVNNKKIDENVVIEIKQQPLEVEEKFASEDVLENNTIITAVEDNINFEDKKDSDNMTFISDENDLVVEDKSVIEDHRIVIKIKKQVPKLVKPHKISKKKKDKKKNKKALKVIKELAVSNLESLISEPLVQDTSHNGVETVTVLDDDTKDLEVMATEHQPLVTDEQIVESIASSSQENEVMLDVKDPDLKSTNMFSESESEQEQEPDPEIELLSTKSEFETTSISNSTGSKSGHSILASLLMQVELQLSKEESVANFSDHFHKINTIEENNLFSTTPLPPPPLRSPQPIVVPALLPLATTEILPEVKNQTPVTTDFYCDICQKYFKKEDTLVKHRVTITHISKLSQIEAEEHNKRLKLEQKVEMEKQQQNEIKSNLEPLQICQKKLPEDHFFAIQTEPEDLRINANKSPSSKVESITRLPHNQPFTVYSSPVVNVGNIITLPNANSISHPEVAANVIRRIPTKGAMKLYTDDANNNGPKTDQQNVDICRENGLKNDKCSVVNRIFRNSFLKSSHSFDRDFDHYNPLFIDKEIEQIVQPNGFVCNEKPKIVENKIRKSKSYKKNSAIGIDFEKELKECIGVASRKSQRTCTSGKQNVLTEFWSSDESMKGSYADDDEDFSKKAHIKRKKRKVQQFGGRKKYIRTTVISASNSNRNSNVLPETTNGDTFDLNHSNSGSEIEPRATHLCDGNASVIQGRRKRSSSNHLYDWPSSSDDELMLTNGQSPNSNQNQYDVAEGQQQHGWIVGDSSKKLVTMLAHSKTDKSLKQPPIY